MCGYFLIRRSVAVSFIRETVVVSFITKSVGPVLCQRERGCILF